MKHTVNICEHVYLYSYISIQIHPHEQNNVTDPGLYVTSYPDYSYKPKKGL